MITIKRAIAEISGKEQNINFLRSMVAESCPQILKALKLIDLECQNVKSPKGYNLIKRDNKKLGFVYYVRYWHEGKMLSSKWCTYSNLYEKACEFAVKNRERLITQYINKNGNEAERFLENYYNPESSIYQNECKRNREISELRRKKYEAIIKDKFIPFIRDRKIKAFADITVPVLSDFQDFLLEKGFKSKTVNDEMAAVGKPLEYLTRKGAIPYNPYLSLARVSVKPEEVRTHGCYELEKLKGVFAKEWTEKTAYLLNLIIYATGMRNSEIKRFCKKDILTIYETKFIDLNKSKTRNGIRLVPLHDTVWEKIMEYSEEMDPGKPIFGDIAESRFVSFNQELGWMMKVSDDFLKRKNITFYSGRHAWKTMMSAGGLGEDAEEIFMGHKVTSDVAKLYNHNDAKGKELMVKKAREIFAILDRMLF